MTSLPEFLIDRIAEDEAVGFRGIGEPSREPLDTVDLDDWPDVIVAHSSRVLADCKAKRAIVEDLAGLVEYDHDVFIVSPQVEAVALRTLKHMAQPHADHAAFDRAWVL